MRSTEQRFATQYVKAGNGCWLWTGGKHPQGYGIFSVAGKSVRAHRFAYVQTNGPVPKGKFVCHRCDEPSCVNPDHLFAGTPRENTEDMVAKGRWSGGPQRKQFCPNGHEFTADNLVPSKDGRQRCRQCTNERARRRRRDARWDLALAD